MLAFSHPPVLPSAIMDDVGTLVSLTCRGSIPRLHVLLSTLRLQPCDCGRMTPSRCGSLGLHRMALSSTPPRRFIQAHPMISASNFLTFVRERGAPIIETVIYFTPWPVTSCRTWKTRRG